MQSTDFSSASRHFQSNVLDPKEAKVIVFLTNHKTPNKERVIKSHLKSFADLSKSVLLIEEPNQVGEWSKKIRTICWENKEILKEVSKVKAIFKELKMDLIKLTDPTHERSKKNATIHQIFRDAKVLKLTSDEDSLKEKIFYYLDNLESSQVELAQEKKTLMGWLKKIHQVYVHQTVIKTFPARQKALIEEVHNHLISVDSAPEKVFVTCGASHGDIAISPCPNDTLSFIEFLKNNTTYSMYYI